MKALTTTQVAEILGMDVSTVRRAIANGDIQAFRLPNGRHWRVWESTLEAMHKTNASTYPNLSRYGV